MNLPIYFYFGLVLLLVVSVGLLHLLSNLGKTGREISDWFCYAPGIDLALAYFMLLPFAIAAIGLGWQGIAIAFLAELTALWLWIFAHELTHREQWNQAKIHRTMSKIAGKWENHLAVWITTLAVPVFWFVRFAEILVYPPLTKLVKLPAYNQKEWINVSRQKFAGLVGYDLIWCLYCDWMTGVWSLGTEMLRNVESFWCPIRFYSEKKCENCQLDFPDINNDWVSADATMEDVTKLLESKYNSLQKERAWYGHSCRSCQEDKAGNLENKATINN
ncbi:MAG: hypothetical protein QNJ38_22905 [Prochloraceae cyanobacterium]|nr:hypothetical protein [Prochloraceae cyanobacterium]